MSNTFKTGQYVRLKPIEQIDPNWVAGIPCDYVFKFCEKPVKIVGIMTSLNETILLVRAAGVPLSYYVNSKAVKSIIGKERTMNNKDLISFWQEVHTLIDEGMEKRDRTVSVFFNPVTGMTVTVHPWPDAEDLWEQYEKGRITKNDFREKIGLPPIGSKE